MADRKKHHEQIKLTIFFKDPLTKVRISKVVSFLHSTFFPEVLEIAYKALEVESIAPIERFRLYEYDSEDDSACFMLPTGNVSSFFGTYPGQPIGYHWRSSNITFTRTAELLLALKEERNEEKNSFIDCFLIFFHLHDEIPGVNTFTILKTHLDKCLERNVEETIRKYMVVVKQSEKRAFILEDTSSLTHEELSGSNVYVTHSEDGEQLIKTVEEELGFIWRLEFEFPEKLSSQNICEADHSEALIDTYIYPDEDSSTSSTKIRTSRRTFLYNYGLKRNRLYFSVEFGDKIYQSSDENSENDLSEDENIEDEEGEEAIETVDEGNELNKVPSQQCSNENSENHLSEDENTEDEEETIETVNEGNESNEGSAQDESQMNTEGSEVPDSLKTLVIYVDNRTSVSEFLTKLQNFVNIQDRSVFHCSDETLSLNQAFKHNDHLQEKIKQFIKWGRVLYDDEREMKLYFFGGDSEYFDHYHLPLICEYLIRGSSEVGQTKREIIKHIQELDKKYENLTFERTRLRLRRYMVPNKALLDHKTFVQCKDYHKRNKTMDEIVIQKLQSNKARLFDCEGQPIDEQSRLVTISRFFIPELVASRQRDLVIGKDCTIPRLKQAISKLSNIPENDIKYTIVKSGAVSIIAKSFLNELIDSEDSKSEEELNEDFKRIMSGDVIMFKDKNEHPIEVEKSVLAFRRHFSAGR